MNYLSKELKYFSIIKEHTLNEYLLYLFSMMYGDVPKKKYDRSLNPSQLTSVATKKVNFPLGHLPFVHIKVCHGLCKCWKTNGNSAKNFPLNMQMKMQDE